MLLLSGAPRLERANYPIKAAVACDVSMPPPGQKVGGQAASRCGGLSTTGLDPPKRATVMGNGASATQLVIDGEPLDLVKIKELLPDLKQQIKQRDALLERCEIELTESRQQLREREADICRLKGEVHKLKSVLQATVHKDGMPDILATIQEGATMAGQETRNKKQGVSGESAAAGMRPTEIVRHDKDFR